MERAAVGTFCLVLHSHLPWLAHHGRWPVGEEWLYQAWTRCYLPLARVLGALAAEGRRDLLTLGVTPVLADQLDRCTGGARAWVADWSLRAEELSARREPALRDLAAAEFRDAARATEDLEGPWRAGGSPVLRRLADDGVVELLGGPATHPFLPLLDARVARIALSAGLDDARWRLGRAPRGIWTPECGHAPGLERIHAAAGVSHLVLDETTMTTAGYDVHRGRRLGQSEVVAVARDLAVTDRIWSSRTGYPAGEHYRDFHALDHPSGTRPYAVTGSAEKRWYAAEAAQVAVRRDAADFADAVRRRLLDVAERDGRPGLVVVALDTELFGHWWHEGPDFLAAVLRLLPRAGVRVTTLARALDGDADHAPLVEGRVDAGAGSWGAGKDFSVWSGEPVAPMLDEAFWVQRRLLDVLDTEHAAGRLRERRPDLDQLLREALLTLSSDWAFMVTRDSAAAYARDRESRHRQRFHRLAELVDAGPAGRGAALAEASLQRRDDGPFAWLDARAYA